MSEEKVLVFGATGERGGAVVGELRQRDVRVVGVARSEAGAAAVRARHGIDEVVIGDLASAPVPGDVTAVHVPLPSAVDADGFVANAQVMVARLRGSRARVVVGMPSVVPLAPTGLAAPDSRVTATTLIREALPEATIVTTTMLLENFSQALAPAILQGALPYPVPADVPVAWIGNRDLADVVVGRLLGGGHAGAVVHAGGREALTGPELAGVIGEAIGGAVVYVPLDEESFAGAMIPFLGAPVGRALAQMTAWAGAEGASLLAPDTDGLDDLMRVERTTVARWATAAFRRP